jgi:hypothetical protein
MRMIAVGSVTRGTKGAGLNGIVTDSKFCYLSDGTPVACTTTLVTSCASYSGISGNQCKD